MSASATFSSDVVIISAPNLRARAIFFDNCSLSLSCNESGSLDADDRPTNAFMVYESLRAQRSTETELRTWANTDDKALSGFPWTGDPGGTHIIAQLMVSALGCQP